MKRKSFRWAHALAVAGLLLATHAHSAPNQAPENEIKAAFLYNFAKFVEWPTPADDFTIGILGEDPFGKNLEETFAGKTIGDKEVVFKRLSSAEQAATCRVVYISASEAPHLDGILAQIEGMPVLTVSDMKGFVGRGGMIGFIRDRKKVAFNINQNVAEKAGLKISSQLLKLARVIVHLHLGYVQTAHS